MNKILVSDIINLCNDSYIVNIKNDDIKINVKGNVKLYLINEKIGNIDINLEDDSFIDIYVFNKNVEKNMVFNINQNNNSHFNLNISIISNEKREIIVNNNIIGNNNNSMIKSRMISNKEIIKMIINVKVFKDTLNNIALEDLKGVNNGGCVHIEPNIICLSNEVSANHLTTIGSLNKEEVDYLMSKGLNEDIAKKIMLKGFIYSNMDQYIKDLEVKDA